MSAFCQNCPKREKCTEICTPLENYLNTKQSDEDLLGIKRLYSDRWIRAKEIPYDPKHFTNMFENKALKRKKGGFKDHYSD